MDEQAKEENVWSNLPADLLILIRSYLLAKDRVRLASTCKSYQLISTNDKVCEPPTDSPLSLSPRLLFSNTLYHPIYGTSCPIKIEDWKNERIHASNHGWFFVTLSWWMMYLVNPITDVYIQVPYFPDEDESPTFNVHFTSTPTSPECQIIRVTESPLPNMLRVYTLRRHQKDWNFYDVEKKISLSGSNPIFYNGVYICLGDRGNFMKFDPTENTCTYSESHRYINAMFEISYVPSYLVESDGELLVVFVARHVKWVRVYRINVTRMVFERIKHLGKRMLYVSNLRSFSETAILEGTGNKIYLPRFYGNDSLMYSLDTKMFHTYTGYSTIHNPVDTKYYVDSQWVKPIFDTTCTEEFDW